MIRPLFIFIVSLCATLSFADEGWNIGLVALSSDQVEDDPDQGVFPPSWSTDNKRFMLIPDIQYQWSQWSAGVKGIGWQSQDDAVYQKRVEVGYPHSSFKVSRKAGPFEYGVSGQLVYSDGTLATIGLLGGPIDYSQTRGLGERSDEFSQTIGTTFPILIQSDAGRIVLATLELQQNNAEFQAEDLNSSIALSQSTYWHPKAKLMSIVDLSERTTLVSQFQLTYYDPDLREELSALPAISANFFLVLSYAFGP